jgi:hypothetical protein
LALIMIMTFIEISPRLIFCFVEFRVADFFDALQVNRTTPREIDIYDKDFFRRVGFVF